MLVVVRVYLVCAALCLTQALTNETLGDVPLLSLVREREKKWWEQLFRRVMH